MKAVSRRAAAGAAAAAGGEARRGEARRGEAKRGAARRRSRARANMLERRSHPLLWTQVECRRLDSRVAIEERSACSDVEKPKGAVEEWGDGRARGAGHASFDRRVEWPAMHLVLMPHHLLPIETDGAAAAVKVVGLGHHPIDARADPRARSDPSGSRRVCTQRSFVRRHALPCLVLGRRSAVTTAAVATAVSAFAYAAAVAAACVRLRRVMLGRDALTKFAVVTIDHCVHVLRRGGPLGIGLQTIGQRYAPGGASGEERVVVLEGHRRFDDRRVDPGSALDIWWDHGEQPIDQRWRSRVQLLISEPPHASARRASERGADAAFEEGAQRCRQL